METIEIGLGFGSNVGDKVQNLNRAMARVFRDPDIGFVAASSIWRSAPWGFTDQDWFANACAVGRTALSPEAALAFTQGVEDELGRNKTFRWGPREIDIDILYLGDQTVTTDRLVVPHKEMFRRAFVLAPLAEIRPKLSLDGVSIDAAAAAADRAGLEIIAPAWRPAAPNR